MTYNTAQTVVPMPLFDGTDPVSGEQISAEERARRVARNILHVDPDVVGLNEMFYDSAKTETVKLLRKRYPYYVKFLDSANNCPRCSDSGLMLFSKFPFVSLSDHAWIAGNVVASANGLPWSEVAFADFVGFCEGYDCAANKGAGLVRIRNPYTNATFTVVFAHLQASYGSGDDEGDRQAQLWARKNQLEMIKNMITMTLTEQQRWREPVYIIGDLNIDGNRVSLHDQEWKYFFDESHYHTEQGYYACGLMPCPSQDPLGADHTLFADGWYYETSPDDLGRTTGPDLIFSDQTLEDQRKGERLDYFLHNKPNALNAGPPSGICVQHLTIAYGVGDMGGDHQYSDHLPIMADVNRAADLCNPTMARNVTGLRDVTNSFTGKIQYPGSMQWHKIVNGGPYAIKLFTSGGGPNRVAFDVYAKNDLSRPIAAYAGQPSARLGTKYVLPEPPYYVRVYGWDPETKKPDRTWTGTYALLISMLGCKSPDESCPLDPNVPDTFSWPGQLINVPDDQIYYSFVTDVGEQGDFPELHFLVKIPNAGPAPFYDTNYEMKLTEAGPSYTPLSPNPLLNFVLQENETLMDGTATGLPGDNGDVREYQWVIKRKTNQGATNFTVRYETNLTYFRPIKMICDRQDDNFGDDDIWYHLNVDEGAGKPRKEIGAGFYYLAEFDNGTHHGLSKLKKHKFVKWLIVDLVEHDSADPNDYLIPFQFGNANTEAGKRHRIMPLPREKEKSIKTTFRWSLEGLSPMESPYEYRMRYDLTHKKNW